MRFQKINENSVRCIITPEELDARGVVIEELVADKEKASQFLRYVLKEADYAVGFHTDGSILNVQISVMPNGAISMMISDDEDMLLRTVLSEMKGRLKSFKQLMESKDGKLDAEDARKLQLPIGQPLLRDETSTNSDEAEVDQIVEMTFWLSVDNLENCISVAKLLNDGPDMPATLYKHNDVYYYEIQIMMSRNELLDFICKTTEYGSQMFPGNGESSREIKEHGTIIIKDSAIKDLSSL